MGGKSKQSQRTKNNVRPSSSSRSAELLSGAMTADGGLVNPSTGKVLPALFPSLAAANFEQGLNPEFLMCIKKLNKKDPITKTKALQELCELVSKSSVEDVVAMLPSWAHFYKILTVDTDRKVREMTQVCQGAVVGACGRRAAPWLRRLLPAWLQAQYDDHAPAMTAAHNSLKNTFPDSKLPEVISFCKVEVMAHLSDNLIGSAEAVISKKTENAEERELQLCRVLTSSLQGLEYFVQHLPAAHHDWLWEELVPLLQHAAYWRHAAHRDHQLRAAWYGALGRVVQRYKGPFGRQFGVKTVRALLAAAHERDALVAAQLWACLLLVMHNVEGWHTYLDKKELLAKRILDVLENGGWGDARHLSNMLLPLLAHLPLDMLTKDFYEAFFKAIYVGLENKKILNSKSERQSWITSLAECLRYLSIQRHEFAVAVATGVHRTWLEKILSTSRDSQTTTNLIKCSATNMASILKYWLKQSKEENGEKYDQLVRNFWQNVGSTTSAQIDKCGAERDEICKLIDGHILLLQSLKSSLTQEAKKQHSIKFDGDQPTVAGDAPVQSQRCDASVAERYKHNLEDLVQMICAHYFEFASKKEISDAILSPLITLLVEFDSENLFVALARQFDVDTVYKFYDKVLRSWLAGDTMRCKAVVDIIFLMMKYMTEDEQDMMFNTFEQFPPPVEEWCVRVSVSHPARAARAARAWLAGGAAGACVARATRRAVAHADARATSLLLVCLAADDTGEVAISESAVSQILATLTAAVADAGSATLEHSAALAARLATALHERHHDARYEDLVHALFQLNLLVPRGDVRLSPATWCEVLSSWQDAAAALPDAARRRALHRAAAALQHHRQLLSEDLNITKVEQIVSLCPYLFEQSREPAGPVAEISAFTARLLDMGEDSALVAACALRHECVTSQLNCLDENDNEAIRTIIEQSSDSDPAELTKTDLMAHINKFLFRAIYLRTMFLHKSSDDGDDDDDQKCWCDSLLGDQYLEEQFCNVLYDYVVLNSLHEGYAFWDGYSIIEESKRKLDTLVPAMIAAMSEASRRRLAGELGARAAQAGYHWAHAERCFVRLARCGPAHAHDALGDVVSGAGFFHRLQASTKWCESVDEEREYETSYLVMLRSFSAAFPEAVDDTFARDAARCRPHCDLDVVVGAYYRHQHTMLYERDIASASWAAVSCNAAVVEFLTRLVARRGWRAPANHWDFATITLCSILCSLARSKDRWGCTKMAMLSRSVLRLFAAVQQFVGDVPAESARRPPAPHVAALPAEWRDIFAADLHDNLFSVIEHVLESASNQMTANRVRVLVALAASTRRMQWERLVAARRAGPHALPVLARLAAAVLARPAHHAYKYLAYYLGELIAVPLVLDDAGKLSQWSDEGAAEREEDKRRPDLSLDYFHEPFLQLRDVVEAALSHVELGETTCETVAGTDSHSMALGWLLLADLMAGVCDLARGDLVQHHIQIYRERKYAESLLACGLRLLPAAVFAHAQEPAAPPPAAHHTTMFLQLRPLSADEASSGGDVGRLACRSVYRSVCGAGCGAARGWWGAAAARPARLLERLVRAHVAPAAARHQLRALHDRAAEIEDAEIRIAWSTSEVSCVYSVEEREVELRVLLSRSHPLVAPRLVAPAAATVGANTHWLALYLAYQNGTLLNALKMWTQAVNARVESAPQCYICYCRLHPGTGRLPRVPCHQCNNKFHNSCLRKWFTTSNKSNCPLCRTTF